MTAQPDPEALIARVEACRDCAFRQPDDRPDYSDAGQCRRFPPFVIEQVSLDGSGANYFSQHWPWMAATDWCGEFRARKDKK